MTELLQNNELEAVQRFLRFVFYLIHSKVFLKVNEM